MRDVRYVREKARNVYGRRRGLWLRDRVIASLSSPAGCAVGAEPCPMEPCPTSLEIGLEPPSERFVLDHFAEVESWVRSWEAYRGSGDVTWEGRRWSRVGDQVLPVRVRFEDMEVIAREAGRLGEWRLLVDRTHDIVELSRSDGSRETSDAACVTSLPDTVRRLVGAIAEVEEGDWRTALGVIDWLGAHRDVARYVRELPIRGIDTKWIEGHRKLVLPLAKALLGIAELPFRKPPDLIRVHALDGGMLPAGFTDLSLTAAELTSLDPKPARVVVCENLVSMLTMPEMAGTLAIFGAGYGVGSRLAVPWLDEVPLYYWGDLDTHGFRILDGFRKHHPGACSVLMDEGTLRECEDLWVAEPEPFTGPLTRLTAAEGEVYDSLLRRSPVPRLEQERIPYRQVMDAFAELVASDRSPADVSGSTGRPDGERR